MWLNLPNETFMLVKLLGEPPMDLSERLVLPVCVERLNVLSLSLLRETLKELMAAKFVGHLGDNCRITIKE